MKRFSPGWTAKLKLFYPVFIGFLVAIAVTTIFMVNISRNAIYDLTKSQLQLEVATIKKMFERERELKLEKVKSDLKVAHELFYDNQINLSREKQTINAVNQITKESIRVTIQSLQLNGENVFESSEFPDMTHDLIGITTTIFQKIDSGYLRLSTNVLDDKGERAVGTFIPNESPVVKTIEKGLTYYGRAFVVNDWYITAYEPIYLNGEIVGMLYVGDKEKDLQKLTTILNSLNIGSTGYVAVLDKNKRLVIHPSGKGKLFQDQILLDLFTTDSDTVFKFQSVTENNEYVLASTYYYDFELFISAIVPVDELTDEPIRNIILGAFLISLIVTVFFVITIFLTTTKRVYRLLEVIDKSQAKLKSAHQALELSEENFKTLFNNSSDEIIVTDMDANIIEVNQVACDSLGYTRDEFLGMNIRELKSPKYVHQVTENRESTISKGNHMFESENVTKSGKVIPVETKSRLFEYKGEKAILSIFRSIEERKELERKVLSAVIKTEEKERERFAKDMHDGLGPLLSAIKLYVNELNDAETSVSEKESYIEQINDMLDQAVTSTREISNNLMPRVIHEYGLIRAVEAFSEKVNKTKKLHIDFDYSGISESLDKDLQLILFRVVSELINNTMKHADAKHIRIKLTKDEERISLAFEDDGIGFNMNEVMNNPKTGIGLKSIISRVKSVNGRVIFKSFKGHGFKIFIDI
ncbi:MAG: Cache 3/Cache 2 fusion domain-containing protein [Bacteroidetes bacterium]|nr:Cache 3/Cache 2 fusion domain-containing protein [Bacteroidota bacterium]